MYLCLFCNYAFKASFDYLCEDSAEECCSEVISLVCEASAIVLGVSLFVVVLVVLVTVT